MLRPDRGVVETSRHRMRRLDVAVVVLQHEGARALEHTRCAAGEPRRMAPGLDGLATGLDANQPHILVIDERIEDADGVATATDTGNHSVRKPAGLVEDLLARLAANDRLEFPHH